MLIFLKNWRRMHMLGYHLHEVLSLVKKIRFPGDCNCTDIFLFLKLCDGYMGLPCIINIFAL